jgi:rhamnulokinase
MNRNDELLGQPWNYRDSRTDGMLNLAFQRVSRAEIFAQTGLQFMEINSLYQLLAMSRRDPELVSQAARFLMVPDFLNWCLCGSRVVEFTNATTTQMLNATTRTWADDLLRRLELPTGIFPEIVPPGTRLGGLRREVSEAVGLRDVQVVAPATHDTGSAVAAVPTQHTGRANWAYISSGTWSLIGVEVRDAVLTEAALQRNVTNEGGLDGTYRLLKNVMGMWLVQGVRASCARRGVSLEYSEITERAAAAEPFRSLVNPDSAEFLRPDDMAAAIQAECRRTGEPVPESEVEVIHVVGGGSRNAVLNQFTADACGVPVVAGPVESTALGNVLVQAMGAGEIGSLSELREVVRNSESLVQYEPRNTAAWNDVWSRFERVQ